MIEVEYLYICIGVCLGILIYWYVTYRRILKRYNILEKGLLAYIKKFGKQTFLFDDETGKIYTEHKK
ncbi:MAG: hypothetical protein GX638_11905 [Crenarchaeota archaeon]|nr:hypothetical protein [Thermoproteota archaeon]